MAVRLPPLGTILMTGAEGFVGRHLVPVLAARLHPTSRLILATRRHDESREAGSPATYPLDLTNPVDVEAAIAAARPDLVIHLAGQASVGRAAGSAADTWSVNLAGSLALASALAKAAPEATVLFASSVETYGLTFNHEIATEDSVLRPQSAYARSKAAAEAMFADVLPGTARLIVARPCNHSGPGQDESYVIPSFAAQIARVEAGEVAALRVGNLEAERDFLDVRDVVAAYMLLLRDARKLPARSTFNIASGHPVRIGKVLDRLCGMSRMSIPIEQDPARMRSSEVNRAAIDPTAIERAIGWRPVHALDDMLSSVLADSRRRVTAMRN